MVFSVQPFNALVTFFLIATQLILSDPDYLNGAELAEMNKVDFMFELHKYEIPNWRTPLFYF